MISYARELFINICLNYFFFIIKKEANPIDVFFVCYSRFV